MKKLLAVAVMALSFAPSSLIEEAIAMSDRTEDKLWPLDGLDRTKRLILSVV
jgi:hypothetical protein